MNTTPRVLLLSGLGPSYYAANSMAGTLFDPSCAERLGATYFGGIRLNDLYYQSASGPQRLLRRLNTAASAPYLHLTTWTLESVLLAHGIDYTLVPLPQVWLAETLPDTGPHELVLVSTTFMWSRASLAMLITAIREAHPQARIVLGGQYSNLKAEEILRAHTDIFGVVRGDGEAAIPALVEAAFARQGFGGVPNLIFRGDDTELVRNSTEYVDLNQHPSPSLPGEQPIVPYESMRGCPFSCKFCSFPAASPLWRYKSAEKINTDWRAYAQQCGTQHVQAYDSTFTAPPRRLRELLGLLPGSGVTWEAFARANAIKDAETVERLREAHCSRLSLGFESMSDKTLKLMKKQVTAAANRKAAALMTEGGLAFRAAFMVGYPGESPADYQLTNDYLVHDYRGQFLLNVFSLMDETMPVWQDAEKLHLRIDDPENPDFGWAHVGMDVATARSLMTSTLEEVRWRSDTAVPLTWQQEFHRPLMPHASPEENLWVEKLVERLAALPLRFPNPRDGRPLLHALVKQLADVDIDIYRDGQVVNIRKVDAD